MNHAIIDNGIDSTITEQRARELLAIEAIYECGECETLESEHVYHVWPNSELERQYQEAIGPFAFLA